MDEKQYGYIAPTIVEGKDYVLGGAVSAPFDVVNPSGDWTGALPVGEPQRRVIETNSCTVWGTHHCLQILLRYLDKLDEDLSERFTAVMSGQKREGNDPQNVAESIRHNGVVPESDLPFNDSITSFDQYLAPKPMTEPYLTHGKQWLDQFEFKHEYIPSSTMMQALQRSPLGVAVYAWAQDADGFYVRRGQDNHWVCLVGAKEKEYWLVFDSYSADATYLKKLRWDYTFGTVKGYSLRAIPPQEIQQKRVWYLQLLDLIAQVLHIDLQILKQPSPAPIIPIDQVLPPPAPAMPTPPAPQETLHEMVYRVCKEEGLGAIMTARLIATIQCESGFDPGATHKNADGTTDYGICQFNNYFFIGPGKPIPSAQVALTDPEFCVRVMCKEFKTGHATLWSCYKKLYPNG